MSIVKRCAVALAATASLVTAAQAGGFSRGVADTDILFDRGTILLGGADLAFKAGVTIVNPNRSYETIRPVGPAFQQINGAAQAGTPLDPATAAGLLNAAGPLPTDGFQNPSYVVPSAAVKVGFGNVGSCAGTFDTPFGGNSDFSNASLAGTPVGIDVSSALATVKTVFVTKEYGLTCQAGAEIGPGRAFGLAGGFIQTLDYEQTVLGGLRVLDLEDTGYGYRLGAGYEIPKIALRALLVYRSEVDVDADGVFRTTYAAGSPFEAVDPFGALGTTPGVGSGTFPQSLELKLQSGIAEGTLAFLNVRWTDWSVFETLNYDTGTGLGEQTLDFFYRDGWTISGGVGRQLSETVAASVALGWDRGTGTGYDIATDTWSLAAGAAFTPRDDIEIRAGGALLYLTSGEQCIAERVNFCSAAFGNAPVKTAGNDVGFALSFSGKLKF